MTSEHIRALTRSPNLASLRKLDVSISLHHRDTPPLEPSDLLAFRTCAFSRQLRELSLAGHAVDDDGIRALVDGDELRGLTHLNLLSNGIGDRGARALANANLPDLVHLDLGQNRLTSRGIHALAHAENLVALEHIDLRGNRDVSLDDIDLLRRAPALPQLSSILA